MRLGTSVLLALSASVCAMLAQTTSTPQKSGTQPRKADGGAEGFAVGPMVLKDEGCARDYARAFGFEGVELRKRLADLTTYWCLDNSARGVFSAVATHRKDMAVKAGNKAYFRHVILVYDPVRTMALLGGQSPVNPPRDSAYVGWIPEADFYAVSAARFDRLIAAGKIPLP